jgi:hypothetical protein
MFIAATLAATVAATTPAGPPPRAGAQVTARAATRIVEGVAIRDGQAELPAHAETQMRTDREGRLWIEFT